MRDISGKNPFRRVSLIFLFAAVVLGGCGGYAYQREIAFESSAQRTEGVVVDLVRSESSKDGSPKAYAAVVDFTDSTGQGQEFVEGVASYPAHFSRGDKVGLLYDPSHPSNAMIDDWTDRFLMTMILSSLSAAFMVLGAILLIASTNGVGQTAP